MNPWNRIAFDYPSHVPTMISMEERRYLYWLTAHWWKGEGHVVEMGPWLGGSTVCLAAGIVANANAGERELHVFDSFVWREFMAAKHPLPIGVGDSFEPFFLKNLDEYTGFLRTHNAWLPDEEVSHDSMAAAVRTQPHGGQAAVSWSAGDPIEILFVDGAKSWMGMRHLLATFCPAMGRGSLLVFQDFKFWGTYWVPATVEFFADHLELTHDLRHNTVSFRVEKPITRSDVERLPTWDELDADTCAALIDAAARRLGRAGDRTGEAVVRLSAARMWLQKGRDERAADVFHQSEESWPLLADDANLAELRPWIEKQTGRIFAPRLKTRLRKIVWPAARFVKKRVGGM